jgi:cytoskeletal protein CcmA (bactofilin family)
MEISSPVGAQHSTAELKEEGGKLTGTLSAAQGSMTIEGTVDGNKCVCSGSSKIPFPMKLDYELILDGDSFSGTVKAGAFGKFNLKAARM